MKRVEIVIPCYDEEECVFPLFNEINRVFNQNIKEYCYSILFIDDGSQDKTLDNIKQLAQENDNVKYISLSKNFGKEAAIFAGLKNSTGDYVVLMDADLQHPPKLLVKMIEEIEKGYDCVGCNRISRHGESIIKSFFSKIFYGFVNKYTSMKLTPGGSDYQMMTRQVVGAAISLQETERFSKGIMSWVGFKTKWIPYENVERYAGKSKWSLFGLFKYSLNGFISFTTTPLRIAIFLGIFVILASIVFSIGVLINSNSIISENTYIILTIVFFSGVIITILGIIGEYLARIYLELKHRPIYIEKESNIKK